MTDFGVFVDCGVERDGLMIGASQGLVPGARVDVVVSNIDTARDRFNCTLATSHDAHTVSKTGEKPAGRSLQANAVVVDDLTDKPHKKKSKHAKHDKQDLSRSDSAHSNAIDQSSHHEPPSSSHDGAEPTKKHKHSKKQEHQQADDDRVMAGKEEGIGDACTLEVKRDKPKKRKSHDDDPISSKRRRESNDRVDE